ETGILCSRHARTPACRRWPRCQDQSQGEVFEMPYGDSQDGLDSPEDHMQEDGFGAVTAESRSPALAAVVGPVYIFIRPRAFFESIAVAHNPMLTLACVWVFGMSNATNRLAKIISGPVDSQPLDDSWTLTWAAIL